MLSFVSSPTRRRRNSVFMSPPLSGSALVLAPAPRWTSSSPTTLSLLLSPPLMSPSLVLSSPLMFPVQQRMRLFCFGFAPLKRLPSTCRVASPWVGRSSPSSCLLSVVWGLRLLVNGSTAYFIRLIITSWLRVVLVVTLRSANRCCIALFTLLTFALRSMPFLFCPRPSFRSLVLCSPCPSLLVQRSSP